MREIANLRRQLKVYERQLGIIEGNIATVKKRLVELESPFAVGDVVEWEATRTTSEGYGYCRRTIKTTKAVRRGRVTKVYRWVDDTSFVIIVVPFLNDGREGKEIKLSPWRNAVVVTAINRKE